MPGLIQHQMLSPPAMRPASGALHYTERRRRQRSLQMFCRHLAREAVRSLYQELVLYPKPGLVSLIDNGSHQDMDAGTFMRSLFSLRRYFIAIAEAGAQGAAFGVLKQLGIDAERRMLKATKGINTHRGAIFSLGMLCAAAASCRAQGMPLNLQVIRATLLIQWGDALSGHTNAGDAQSNGLRVAAQHAVGGAREEAALGFPAVFEIALPQLQATLAAGRDWQCAKIDALFALMAHVSDTNIYHRGGDAGADIVQQRSRAFLAEGGTGNPDWMTRAEGCHREFVLHRLSPGGAADLLAASCLLHAVCAADHPTDLSA